MSIPEISVEMDHTGIITQKDPYECQVDLTSFVQQLFESNEWNVEYNEEQDRYIINYLGEPVHLFKNNYGNDYIDKLRKYVIKFYYENEEWWRQEQNPSKEWPKKKKRPELHTKQTMEERWALYQEIRVLIAHRWSDTDILGEMKNKYGMTWAQTKRCIRKCKRFNLEEFDRPAREHVIESKNLYDSVIRDDVSTTKERLEAQKATDNLLGLKAPSKHIVLGRQDADEMEIIATLERLGVDVSAFRLPPKEVVAIPEVVGDGK